MSQTKTDIPTITLTDRCNSIKATIDDANDVAESIRGVDFIKDSGDGKSTLGKLDSLDSDLALIEERAQRLHDHLTEINKAL